ncbi:hypothetical protein BDR04DRAFT_1105202 [Suillus decipiens]|nr:hypothetical protein BDR04DRAFT_1105202 [Suillus decipiens]
MRTLAASPSYVGSIPKIPPGPAWLVDALRSNLYQSQANLRLTARVRDRIGCANELIGSPLVTDRISIT